MEDKEIKTQASPQTQTQRKRNGGAEDIAEQKRQNPGNPVKQPSEKKKLQKKEDSMKPKVRKTSTQIECKRMLRSHGKELDEERKEQCLENKSNPEEMQHQLESKDEELHQ